MNHLAVSIMVSTIMVMLTLAISFFLIYHFGKYDLWTGPRSAALFEYGECHRHTAPPTPGPGKTLDAEQEQEPSKASQEQEQGRGERNIL